MRIERYNLNVGLVRKAVLIRLSFLINKLSETESARNIAGYLRCSVSTVYKLKNYKVSTLPSEYPVKSVDRLLNFAKLLGLDYEIVLRHKNNVETHSFDVISAVNANMRLHDGKLIATRESQ